MNSNTSVQIVIKMKSKCNKNEVKLYSQNTRKMYSNVYERY